ncbi:MAG: HD domain-containing phosphohydrolase [Rhodocyclaceae bacterium]
MAIKADLRRVIHALSDALDLVGVDDMAHGKRVGIIAAQCGRAAGLPEDDVSFLFDLGMLHDLGVSSTRTHGNLVGIFEWAEASRHCEVGYNLLRGFAPFAAMALPVRYHHTRWEKLCRLNLPKSVAWQANLTFLADRVDALAARYYADNSILMFSDEIRAKIGSYSGSFFAPELVELFLQAARADAFWLLLEPRSVQACLIDIAARSKAYPATTTELKQVAGIFASIVDAKTPFTAEHSLGVAHVARFLAERMGVSEESCDKLEIAGLLHDLGKLRIPDEILDKPGKLDPRERKIMNTHSFETFNILRNIPGFEDITAWAAYHHEEPGGTGYPFGLRGEDLALEARILRVSDIFQAMVQSRPYRSGMGREEVGPFMLKMAEDGKMDPTIVRVLLGAIDEALAVASPAFPSGNFHRM